MSNKTLVVIGAGLAGLATAGYAAMNGYRTIVFEQAVRPGGLACAWQRGAYTVEGGIHFVPDPSPGDPLHRLYEELGVPAESFTILDPALRFIDEITDRSVDVTHDLDRLALELKSVRASDYARILELVNAAKSLQGLTIGILEKPVELMSFADKAARTWRMRRALRLFAGPFARPAREYAKTMDSPFTARLVSQLFSSDAPLWLAIATLALAAENRLGLLKQGSAGLVGPIETQAKELGCNMRYQSPVAAVRIANDRVGGVELADGEIVEADYVVSAADGRRTLFELLDGRYLDDATRLRYASWPVCAGLFMATFGVTRTFAGLPPLWTIILQRPFFIGNHTIDTIFVRLFDYAPSFAPPGHGVVQVSFETDWEYWHTLAETDPERYAEEKDRLASECLHRLESYFAGIRRRVVLTNVATPHTTERYTSNYRGSIMGWLPTPEALTTEIPHTLPGLSGFLMAGQWVTPGGGVSGCIQSGRNVVQLLCRMDDRAFHTAPRRSRPPFGKDAR